jgi:hypothetical protein
MERNSISSTENPQGLYRWPAIDFPRELLKVFCAQISLQSVYLMTPSNGVVEGEGAQIRLWPIGRQPGSYPETGFWETPTHGGSNSGSNALSHRLSRGSEFWPLPNGRVRRCKRILNPTVYPACTSLRRFGVFSRFCVFVESISYAVSISPRDSPPTPGT